MNRFPYFSYAGATFEELYESQAPEVMSPVNEHTSSTLVWLSQDKTPKGIGTPSWSARKPLVTTDSQELRKCDRQTNKLTKKRMNKGLLRIGRCRSSYKVFSDLLRKQYTKQQNNGP